MAETRSTSILPGRNYGWPDVSLGTQLRRAMAGQVREGRHRAAARVLDAVDCRLRAWPSTRAIAFPAWRGNVFVGALRFGEIAQTGHLQRVVFNDKGEEMRREMLLTELRQRIRDVRQGPDGLLYLLTDENPGALLRLEPAP